MLLSTPPSCSPRALVIVDIATKQKFNLNEHTTKFGLDQILYHDAVLRNFTKAIPIPLSCEPYLCTAVGISRKPDWTGVTKTRRQRVVARAAHLDFATWEQALRFVSLYQLLHFLKYLILDIGI